MRASTFTTLTLAFFGLSTFLASAGQPTRLILGVFNTPTAIYLLYTVNDDKSLTIEFSAKSKGWIGLGFNSGSLMAGADMVQCTYNSQSGKPECYQYLGVSKAQPTLVENVKVEILDGGYDVASETWDIKFKKVYAVGGPIDLSLETSSTVGILGALGASMSLSEKHAYKIGALYRMTKQYTCTSNCQLCDGNNQNFCLEKNKFLLYPSAPFSIYYTLYPSRTFEKIRIQIKGKNSGYVLIGFGTAFLPGTDGLLINYDAKGNGICTDVKVNALGTDLINDTLNDCRVESFTPRTTLNDMDITITRRLKTWDAEDYVLQADVVNDILVTYGPSDNFDYFRQIYKLGQFILYSISKKCTFGCADSGCSGPDENQCSGGCSLEIPAENTCLGFSPKWENPVIINENYTLFYNVEGTSRISLRVQGKPAIGWVGLAFSKTLQNSNILVNYGKMDYLSKRTVGEVRAFSCESMKIESNQTPPQALTNKVACQTQGNSYQDELGGINYFFLRPLAKIDSSEYEIKTGEKQNWLLVIGENAELSSKPISITSIPEFTLSSTEIKCPCLECKSGMCVKCPQGKQVFNNSCVAELSESWNYFTIPAPNPIEAAYTLLLPHDGSNYLSTNKGYIQFNFTGLRLGWLGLGLGTTMANSDMFAIHKNGKDWNCTDLISKAKARPSFDEWLVLGQNNCELVSQLVQADGSFIISVKRPFQASDGYDFGFTINKMVDFIWAINNQTQYLSYHGDSLQKQRGKFSLNITYAKLCHPSCMNGCTGPQKTDCSSDDLCASLNKFVVDSNFNLYYYICNDRVVFRAYGLCKGWVGIGFGEGMNKVDMNVLFFDSDGNANCTDMWSTGNEQPKSDVSLGGTNDCTLIKGTRNQQGIIDVWFSRPFNSTDSKYDTPLTDILGKKFSVAFGDSDSSDTFKQHSSVSKLDFVLSKLNCTSDGCARCPQIQSCLCSPQNKLALRANFSLYYQICQNDVLFRALGVSPGWFGLAFGAGMTNVDMLMINFTDSMAGCYDLWATSNGMPGFDGSLGGSNDCKIINGSRDASGYMDVWFSRPIKATNNNYDSEFKLGSQNISFAFGSSDEFTKHQDKVSKAFVIGNDQICSSNCSLCSGPELDNCLSCKSGFQLSMSRCIETINKAGFCLHVLQLSLFAILISSFIFV